MLVTTVVLLLHKLFPLNYTILTVKQSGKSDIFSSYRFRKLTSFEDEKISMKLLLIRYQANNDVHRKCLVQGVNHYD